MQDSSQGLVSFNIKLSLWMGTRKKPLPFSMNTLGGEVTDV